MSNFSLGLTNTWGKNKISLKISRTPHFLFATAFPQCHGFYRMDEYTCVHALWKEKTNCLGWKCRYFVVMTCPAFAHICIWSVFFFFFSPLKMRR